MSYTVADLIADLQDYPEDAEVRLAIQPSWPFEHSIRAVAANDQRYNTLITPEQAAEAYDTDPGWYVTGPDFCLNPDGDHDTDEPLAGPFATEQDAERWQDENPPVVYIAEGHQLGYLPGDARHVFER